MDIGTFAITSTKLSSEDISQADLLIGQSSKATEPPSLPNNLLSPFLTRAIAVVDRTANISNSAEAIVSARLSGSSPYAPDLVIVHEAIIEAFGLACQEYANRPLTSSSRELPLTSSDREFRTVLDDANGEGKVKMPGAQSKGFAVVEILDRYVSYFFLNIRSTYFDSEGISSRT